MQLEHNNTEVTAVIIKSSKAIRNNYREISQLCKSTREPVHLTVNGEGDLVVVDIATFYLREAQLNVREQLLAVEEDRLLGLRDFTAHEVIAEGRAMLRDMGGSADSE